MIPRIVISTILEEDLTTSLLLISSLYTLVFAIINLLSEQHPRELSLQIFSTGKRCDRSSSIFS
jgi:hypothetical protein